MVSEQIHLTHGDVRSHPGIQGDSRRRVRRRRIVGGPVQHGIQVGIQVGTEVEIQIGIRVGIRAGIWAGIQVGIPIGSSAPNAKDL